VPAVRRVRYSFHEEEPIRMTPNNERKPLSI
jgi:hypothetical protein